MTLEQKLQEERRIRIAIEREYSDLKEKYDQLVSESGNTSKNPDADYLRNQRLRSYRL